MQQSNFPALVHLRNGYKMFTKFDVWYPKHWFLQLKWPQAIRKYKTVNKQNFTSSSIALPEYFCMYLTLCVSWLPSWNQLTIGSEAAITAACMLTVLFSATVHEAGFTMNLGAASRRSAMLKNKKKCWVSSIIIHY